MEGKRFKTPCGALVNMQVVHFGKIMFNFQFVALALMAAGVLTLIFAPLYYLILILLVLVTLGGIYAIYPEFSSLWDTGETFTQLANLFAEGWKYTVPILAVLSITSIICLSLDRRQKHTARIVISSILCVLSVVVLIFKLVNGGAAV